jgi:hypothetical protein
MARLVLVVVVAVVLAGCGVKRASSLSFDACPGFAPGPITVTSCP